MTATLGLNVPPDAGTDLLYRCRNAGAQRVRLVYRPFGGTRHVLSTTWPLHLYTVLAFDATSYASFDTPTDCYRHAVEELGDFIGDGDTIECGPNEWDSTGETSTATNPDAVVAHIDAAKAAFNDMGCRLIGPPVVNGQPGVITDRMLARSDQLDAWAIHLYPQGPLADAGEVAASTLGAFEARLDGLPIEVTEFPLWGDVPEVVLGRVERADVYCAVRWSGWPDALWDEDGNPLLVERFEQLAKEVNEMATVEERLAQLEHQQSVQTRALAHIGEGKLGPGLDTLAADLDELDDTKYKDWKPAWSPK